MVHLIRASDTVFITYNLTAQQNQHWLNRVDSAVSFSTVYSGSFAALVCTAADDVPGLASSFAGGGQHGMAGVSMDHSLSPCLEFLSPMAANPHPVGVARSHFQHSSHTRLEPCIRNQNQPLLPGAVHRKVLLCLATLVAPTSISLTPSIEVCRKS